MSHPAAAAATNPGVRLWLLTMITLTGTLAMHIFVPTVPLVARGLETSVGLAMAQLVYGPVSDQFGRKPVLIVGTALYTAGSLIAMVAPSIDALIAARFFEALGDGAGMVLGRAIVHDIASGPEAARKRSLMNLMVILGPGLSPMIGGAVAAANGWRTILLALAALGLANLLLIWRRLPETKPAGGADAGTVLRSDAWLLRSRRFLGYAVGGGCATTAMYAYIGAAPFIFSHQLHRPMPEVGLYLALNILGVWFGSLAVSRLAGKVGMTRLLLTGNLLSCAGAFVFLLFVLAGPLHILTVVLPMLLVAFGAGISSPMAATQALNVNQRSAARPRAFTASPRWPLAAFAPR